MQPEYVNKPGWALYQERMGVIGETSHQMWQNHTRASVARRILASPSFRLVRINGVDQRVAIVHRTNINEKRIIALPGERILHGGIVEFGDTHYLITEIDGDREIYERGLMKRCNHILRWIDKDGQLVEKWCIVEDGTKYLIGEFSEDMMSIGDSRIAVTVGKDADTVRMARGMRFLIDNSDSEEVLAYQITKPNRFFSTYEEGGVFRFILNEVPLTKNDNIQKRIADFNNWMPPRDSDGDHVDSDLSVGELVAITKEQVSAPPTDDKEVWL